MLLNEFLKAHKKVHEMEAAMTQMAAQLSEQATQIQKVSEQLEVNKTAPKSFSTISKLANPHQQSAFRNLPFDGTPV